MGSNLASLLCLIYSIFQIWIWKIRLWFVKSLWEITSQRWFSFFVSSYLLGLKYLLPGLRRTLTMWLTNTLFLIGNPCWSYLPWSWRHIRCSLKMQIFFPPSIYISIIISPLLGNLQLLNQSFVFWKSSLKTKKRTF